MSEVANQKLRDKSGGFSNPKIAITYRRLDDLKINPRNPRLHSKKQIQQIAQSISSFQFNVPVLVDGESRVIGGHGRILAAKELGLGEIPTICLEHLTDLQARAFMIADNQLTVKSEWDDRLLGEQLKFLSEAELHFDIEATGFDLGDIDMRIERLAIDDDDDCNEPISQPITHKVTRPGDLWVLGPHRIYCGDALDGSSYTTLMEDKKATMVFIDPPYNVPIEGHASGLGKVKHKDFAMACGEMTSEEFTKFLLMAAGLLARHSLDGSIHFICMDWRHAHELLDAGTTVYSELKNLCVWAKDNAGMGSLYRSQHELIFVFKSGHARHRNLVQLGKHGRNRTNLWRYPGANSFSRSTAEGNLLELHPTVKPVALVADAIKDCSARGEIILDAFMGSGTTLIAAERTGRVCYGIEIDPSYVDIMVRRWQQFSGKSALHATKGHTFDELAQGEHGD